MLGIKSRARFIRVPLAQFPRSLLAAEQNRNPLFWADPLPENGCQTVNFRLFRGEGVGEYANYSHIGPTFRRGYAIFREIRSWDIVWGGCESSYRHQGSKCR